MMPLVYENGKYILKVSDFFKPAELSIRHSERKYFVFVAVYSKD